MAAVIVFFVRLIMDNMPTEEQTYRAGVIDRLADLQEGINKIDKKVTYTNGKVRKIIVAIFLLGGILIGELFSPRQIVAAIATHFL